MSEMKRKYGMDQNNQTPPKKMSTGESQTSDNKEGYIHYFC